MAAEKPQSEVAICNLALDRLGQRAISSIDSPTTEVETICARHYHAVRRELLRSFIFNFAKKYDTWEEATDVTPPFTYAAAFYLPDDFIRLCVIGDITIGAQITGTLYDIVESYLYTSSDDSGDLNVVYIYDAKNVLEFDPLFTKLLWLNMANNMAYKFTLKNSIISKIEDEISKTELRASAISGQEKPPIRIQNSKMRDARRRGGMGASKYFD
jgi:hypothetical protein